jgi:hypothetical protein
MDRAGGWRQPELGLAGDCPRILRPDLVHGVRRAHLSLILVAAPGFYAAALVAMGGDSQHLKERPMTPKFLREEAARFRGMAEETTREASRVRLLAMAADYEARATAADGFVVAPPVEEAAPEEAAAEPSTEADPGEPDPGGKLTLGPKAIAPAGRRSVGRPRLRIAP